MILDLGTGSAGGPTAIDHVLVVAVTILLPIHDLLFWYPRLLRADSTRRERGRSLAYFESAVIEWALSAVVVVLWIARGRPLPAIGLGMPGGWGFYAAAGLALGLVGFLTWQRLSLVRSPDPEVKSAVLRQLEPLRALLPRTPGEMRGFIGISLTAGICEELLFRGFLLWYLGSRVPVLAALVLGAALFGMAHAYQGSRGVLQTGVVGLGLVVLYVVSGSLWVPMLIHAFVDVNSGLIAYTFLRRPVAPPRPDAGPPAGLDA